MKRYIVIVVGSGKLCAPDTGVYRGSSVSREYGGRLSPLDVLIVVGRWAPPAWEATVCRENGFPEEHKDGERGGDIALKCTATGRGS
jgi:hypothetical protein